MQSAVQCTKWQPGYDRVDIRNTLKYNADIKQEVDSVEVFTKCPRRCRGALSLPMNKHRSTDPLTSQHKDHLHHIYQHL